MSKRITLRLVVFVDDSIDDEVVMNDVRDYVQGSFDGLEFAALPQYTMDVADIEVLDE